MSGSNCDSLCKDIRTNEEVQTLFVKNNYKKTLSKKKSMATSAEPLNFATNILLVYRLEEMRRSATLNNLLALLCLAYCGVNVTLIYVNYVNSHIDTTNDNDNDDDLPVSDLTYHLLEFWATFGFAVLEVISLVSTPKSLLSIYANPLILKLIMFFNIVATLVPALLVSLNLERFEIISHEIEYVNELTVSQKNEKKFCELNNTRSTSIDQCIDQSFLSLLSSFFQMTFVDLVLLWSLCRLGDVCDRSGQIIITCIAGFVALVQLGVYNLLGQTPDGDMVGEVPAHYFEFSFEIISSLIAFWFCMDNKLVADEEIGLILYGKHQDCLICGAKSIEFESTYFNSAGQPECQEVPTAPVISYGSMA